MRNFFSKTELPPIADLFNALMGANEYIHPEWSEAELIFNTAHLARSSKNHKQFAIKVNEICGLAIQKQEEIELLEQQLQLHTDINN